MTFTVWSFFVPASAQPAKTFAITLKSVCILTIGHFFFPHLEWMKGIFLKVLPIGAVFPYFSVLCYFRLTISLSLSVEQYNCILDTNCSDPSENHIPPLSAHCKRTAHADRCDQMERHQLTMFRWHIVGELDCSAYLCPLGLLMSDPGSTTSKL